MRYYSSVAQATTLAANATAGETSIQVAATTGLPVSHPFTLVLAPGTAEEEIVTVTGTSGTTLSVVRGEDGTTAMAHSAGTEVRHMVTARDFRDSQEHIAATSNVHGVSGTIVSTTAAQTLTNKTIDGSQNTLVNIPAGAIVGSAQSSTYLPRVARGNPVINGQGVLLGPFSAASFPGATENGLSCVVQATGVSSGVSSFEIRMRTDGGNYYNTSHELPVATNGLLTATTVLYLSDGSRISDVDIYLELEGVGSVDFGMLNGGVTALFLPGASYLS